MPSARVIRALSHPFRQRMLRVLANGGLTYSDLLSKLEPEGSDRGRFNYHLRVLREAGLVGAVEGLYALTSSGKAASRFLKELSENPEPPPLRKRPQAIVWALLVVGLLGTTALFGIVFTSVLTARTSPASTLGWESPALLAEVPKEWRMEIASSGDGLVVVKSDQSGTYGKRLVPDGGQDELTLTSVASSTTWRQRDIVAELDSKGNTIVLWVEDDRLLFSRQYEVGIGWETPEMLYQGVGVGGVDLSMSPAGDAAVVWRSCSRVGESSSGQAAYDCAIMAARYEQDNGWGSAKRINSVDFGDGVGAPRIGLDQAGNALVVWTERPWVGQESRESLWMNRYIVVEGGWQSPTPITGESRYVNLKDLSVDSSGRAVGVWLQAVGERPALYASQFTPGHGWGTPYLISPDAGSPAEAITNSRGDILLTWTEWDPPVAEYRSPLRLLASRFVPGAGWEPATVIWRFDMVSNYLPDYPEYAAALDPEGRALIVWRGYSAMGGDTTPIYASRFVPNAGWSTRELVEKGSDQGGFPGGFPDSPYPAFDSEGNALVVWKVRDLPWRTPATPNRDSVIFMSRFVSAEVLLQEGLDDANLRLTAFENRLLFLAGLGLVLLAVTSTLSLFYRSLKRRLADPAEIWNGSDGRAGPGPRKEAKRRAGGLGWARRVGDALRLRTAKAIAIVPVGRSLLLAGSALLLVGLFLPWFTVSYGISAFAHPYLPPGEYNGPAAIHTLGYFAGGWDHFPWWAWYAMALFGWLILVAALGVTSALVARRFSWIGVSGILVLVLIAIQMSRAASGNPFASVASPSVGFAFGFGLAVTGAALIETGARVKTPDAALAPIPTPLPVGILLIGLGIASIVGSLAFSVAVHQQMNLIIGLGLGIPSTVGGAFALTSLRKARLRPGVFLMVLGFVSVVAGFFAWIYTFRIGGVLPVIDAVAVAWTFGVVLIAVGMVVLARPSVASGPASPSASP